MSKDKKYGNELKSEDWSHHVGYSTQRTMQMAANVSTFCRKYTAENLSNSHTRQHILQISYVLRMLTEQVENDY